MKKIKIQIKHRLTGSILFEYESTDNTIKQTVIEAIKSGANLSVADLSGANLSRANLSRANLSGADLSVADLSGANLSVADLSGANLSVADLSRANLSGANLSRANLSRANLYGADLSRADLSVADLSVADLSRADLSVADLSGALINDIKVKKMRVFSGLYSYLVIAFISEDGEKYVRMGCYVRKVSEWEADFWNNENEFPNDNSEKSNLRLFAFETAKRWFEIIEK